jgi:hypothetical protein
MTDRNWSPEVARALHELNRAAPLPPSTDSLHGRTVPRARPRRAVSVAAAALVLAGAAGTWAAVARDDATPAGGDAIEVHHAIYDVSITATLECSTPSDTTGTFDTAVVETWADRSGRQWRSQITYPDGTTYDSIYQGSAIYPSAAFERGTLIDSQLGCIGPEGEVFNLVALDAAMFTLTILDELAPDERPYVLTYEELGTLVDTGVLDSRGRMVDTWEQRTSGFAGFGSDADNADMAVSQVTTWWVAPDSTVTERTFRSTIESIGTATSTQTLVSTETIIVGPEVFSTDGYRSLGAFERPDPPTGGPETTANASDRLSPFDSGASMIVYVRPGADAEQVELVRGEIARKAPVGDGGLVYLDAAAALAEAQRVYADVPAMLGQLDMSTVPTMFQLFPTGALAPELAQMFASLPNVLAVSTPTSPGSDDIPLTFSTGDTGPTATLAPSGECSGDDLDLASEPPLWRQNGYGTWFRAGCVVRVDVITDRPGPDHCDWGNTRVLVFGTPIGVPFTSPDNSIQYVRDPANEYGYGFAATFDSQATLPPDAVDSGYSSDNEQLWSVPGDDRFIYLVLGDRTERWPKGNPPLCS